MLLRPLPALRQTASPSVAGRHTTYVECHRESCFHHQQKEFVSLHTCMRCDSFAFKRKADNKSRSLSFFRFKMNTAVVLVYNHRTRNSQSLSCAFTHFLC